MVVFDIKFNKLLLTVLIGLFVMHGFILAAEDDLSPHLKWKVGDSWVVRSWNHLAGYKDGKMYIEYYVIPYEINFKVREIVAIKDFKPKYNRFSLYHLQKLTPEKKSLECFEVDVTFPITGLPRKDGLPNAQDRYRVYYRKDTGNVIRILDRSIVGNGKVKESIRDLTVDLNTPYLSYSSGRTKDLFDWPIFDKGNFEYKHSNRKVKRKIVQRKNVKELERLDGGKFTGYQITLSAVKEENKKIDTVFQSVQKWKKGVPWWQEIVSYDKDGKIEFKAVLLEFNGKKQTLEKSKDDKKEN